MHYYSIHDIIRVRSEVILYELEYFKSEYLNDPDLDVKITDFKGSLQFRRKIIQDKTINNYIKYSEHFGSLGAQFGIKFNDPIEVTVNKMISNSRHVLYVNLVEPLLRFLFISKGYILLHSACIDKDGHGLLISAPPDTGKTTTILKCVKKGYSFLSDDMTIIRLPNEALCFPKPMTISAHTFKTAVTVSDTNNDTNGMRLRSIIHSKSGRSFMHKLAEFNVPIFTINTLGQSIIKPPKFDINTLLQSVSITEKTKLNALYFLEREGNEIINLEIDHALNYAIANSDDAFLFPPYKDLLEFIEVKGKNARQLLEDEKKLLRILLSGISSYIIKSATRSWYNMILQYNESELNKI